MGMNARSFLKEVLTYMNDHLAKPIDPEKLYSILCEYLQKK